MLFGPPFALMGCCTARTFNQLPVVGLPDLGHDGVDVVGHEHVVEGGALLLALRVLVEDDVLEVLDPQARGVLLEVGHDLAARVLLARRVVADKDLQALLGVLLQDPLRVLEHKAKVLRRQPPQVGHRRPDPRQRRIRRLAESGRVRVNSDERG